MTAPSLAADLPIRWGDVAACPVAALDSGRRAVLVDTAGRYWLAALPGTGAVQVLVGPVGLDAVLDVAALVLSGRPDHHGVTDLVNRLALIVVGLAAQQEEARPCAC